jgi:ubiquinone biosynthesis protein
MQQVIIVIGLVLEAALVAVVARRVLGVPVGWPRSVVVGLIMIFGLGAMINVVLDTAGLGSPTCAAADTACSR